MIGFILNIVNCGGSSNTSSNNTSNNTTPPVLYNLGIDFDDFDLSLVGDRDPFFIFGDVLSGSQLNPTFEYYLIEGSSIVSPIEGIILDITEREDTNDYSVVITTSENSIWWVVLDHVLNLTISEGDNVSYGDKLGVAGTWEQGLGRTELQIINTEDGLSYCPTELLDSSVKSNVENNMQTLMSDWEEYNNDDSLYNENSMNAIGCLEETVQG